jgi:HlyD family secretion protein
MARSTLIAAVLIAGLGCAKKEAQSFRTEPVTRGPVSEVVSATGDVQAIITVNVGSQVSGIISRLYVDWNSQVKKGQLLATLDPRLFQAQLESANASLASAEANVQKASVALLDARRQEKRIRELLDQRLVAQSDVDTAQANREGAEATLAGSRASVLQAKAQRTQAVTNLAYTRIQSPIDGVVVSRAIDVGQTVAAAFQAPTLFTIANDLTKMQILANIDEADVGKVHEGLPASFTVDAYPGETFNGTISQVRQSPTTIQNVVTYAAVIDAPNPERKLRQGMTAAVTVTASKRDEAVRVVNAALRWKPDAAPASDGAAKPAGGTPQARAATPERASRNSNGSGEAGGGRGAGGGPARAAGRSGRVYKLENGKPVAVALRLGISDGQRTEVIDGLAEGDQVVTGDSGAGGGGKPAGQRRGPF